LDQLRQGLREHRAAGINGLIALKEASPHRWNERTSYVSKAAGGNRNSLEVSDMQEVRLIRQAWEIGIGFARFLFLILFDLQPGDLYGMVLVYRELNLFLQRDVPDFSQSGLRYAY
jgi:hypothetical protein